MRTTKPISTISYNSPEFLAIKLEELRKAKIISFWVFIKHKAEEDEKKDHIHLYCVPSKMIQTDDLKNEFIEINPECISKPFCTISFFTSKFDDWYLYSLHDRRYLLTKGQTRKFHYSREDMRCSDEDELDYLISQIDMISLMPYSEMIDALEHGDSFDDFFSRGLIPLPQLRNFQLAWQLLRKNHFHRKGESHTPK